jgi:hypothetical protein
MRQRKWNPTPGNVRLHLDLRQVHRNFTMMFPTGTQPTTKCQIKARQCQYLHYNDKIAWNFHPYDLDDAENS